MPSAASASRPPRHHSSLSSSRPHSALAASAHVDAVAASSRGARSSPAAAAQLVMAAHSGSAPRNASPVGSDSV